ncbi:MAG: D-alanyl-D-alanine carboxypeptidase family protein, partial [Actinocrinis sp.]
MSETERSGEHSTEGRQDDRSDRVHASAAGAFLDAITQADDRRLGVRVIAVVIALCVAVTAWAYSRPGHGSASGEADQPYGPAAKPYTPAPLQLFQQVSASFTIPARSGAFLPWPSAGQSAVEVEGVGRVGSSGDTAKPVPIASVAKTMTAYLILTRHPLSAGDSGPEITVAASEAAAYTADLAAGQTLVEVKAGERISERDALEAMMLASADNVAKIVARWDAGSIDAFVTSMNAAAKELGMTHTRYTDPSGLDPATVSTAPDQIKLAEAA